MISVAATSLVSPLGSTSAEHVFFLRAEVTPYASGAFTNEDGESLPIHDCGWIPACRPWSSRIALLVKRALAGVQGEHAPPCILIAPREALDGAADVRRFLAFSGHRIASIHSGAAAFAAALAEARERLRSEPEVVVAAVDSLLSRASIESWYELRYSPFTRNPLPPSEGAAALRLVAAGKAFGRIQSVSAQQSEANDENDVATDGAALTRVFAELGLPPKVALLVGPRDVDELRSRDHHIACARNGSHFEETEMLSLEGRIGALGCASGLASAALALAWLRHGALESAEERPRAVSWARSADGTVAGTLLEAEAL